jgi:AcrR family transcriptional regulator
MLPPFAVRHHRVHARRGAANRLEPMTEPPSGPTVPADRRVDARRNHEQLVEGAIRVLGDDPAASLQEIAAAAGFHRATLHRHFRSREDLLEVLRRRAALRALDNVERAEDEAADGPPAAVLEAFVRRGIEGALPDGLWRIGTYYGTGADEYRPEIRARVARLLASAQAAGAARTDLEPLVLVAVWNGVSYGMLPLVHDGTLDVDAATAVVLATLRGEH